MHRLVSLLAVTIAAATLHAQPGNSAKAGDSVDLEWQTLAATTGKHSPAWPRSEDVSGTDRVRSQAVAAYIADADALKDFYTRYPTHSKAKEAKRREALALLAVQNLGDPAQRGRCKQLVKEIRSDTTIAPTLREEVAAFSDNLDIATQPQLDAAQKRAAFEAAARALIAEFPGVVGPIESLVSIAQSSPDEHATAVAKDVLAMPAPDVVKAQAQLVLARIALKGRALTDLAAATLGMGNPVELAVGKPIVVYSWAANAPGAIADANTLAAQAPAGTIFIGVCLDMGDLTAAKARAAQESAPGEQIYDPMGAAGPFAGRLYLTAPGLIYLADRDGTIVTTNRSDLAAIVAKLTNL
jgi:hypothetical protein